MFVSFIQFIFDPYLDQFEARPSQAWRPKMKVIVLSLALSDPIFHPLLCLMECAGQ